MLLLIASCLVAPAGGQEADPPLTFGSIVQDGDADVDTALTDLVPSMICPGTEPDVWVVRFEGNTSRALSGADAGAPAAWVEPCQTWSSTQYPGSVPFSAADHNGSERIYLDRDGSGAVSPDDLRLSGPSPGVVAAGDEDVDRKLAPRPMAPAYVEADGAPGFGDHEAWYLSQGQNATVAPADVRMGGWLDPVREGAGSWRPPEGGDEWPRIADPPDDVVVPVAGAASAGPLPAVAWSTTFSAVALVALVPLLDRAAPRAGSAALVASWLLHAAVLLTATIASLVSLGVLVWNGAAYAAYRARRRTASSAAALAGGVGLVALLEVHADVADHTWRRDFWLRATSDHDGDRVVLHAEAHLGAYHAFFYRRHRVEVTPTLRRLPGTPPRVEVVGTGEGASGPLALVVRPEVAEEDGVVEASVEALAEFVGRPWRVLFSRWGLQAEGEVGGDRVQQRVGLGTYRWTDGA